MMGAVDVKATCRAMGDQPETRKRWALQAKKQKNAAKEAFKRAALAQLFFRPGGRQTGAIFLAFGVEGE
jgi:hypothetical protein